VRAESLLSRRPRESGQVEVCWFRFPFQRMLPLPKAPERVDRSASLKSPTCLKSLSNSSKTHLTEEPVKRLASRRCFACPASVVRCEQTDDREIAAAEAS
jgi:hypothetical protein